MRKPPRNAEALEHFPFKIAGQVENVSQTKGFESRTVVEIKYEMKYFSLNIWWVSRPKRYIVIKITI